MARPLRIEYPGAWYHVMNRGAARQSIFHDEKDRSRFLEALAETSGRFGIELHAWCLMGNHYHLMVRTPRGNLGRAMRHLNGVYTQRFNRSKGRDGPLFRGRYKAVLVQAEAHWTHLSRYIHRNPLEVGYVERLDQYVWSSYRAYLGMTEAPFWLHTQTVLGEFVSRSAYRRFVEQCDDDGELGKLYSGQLQATILGSNQFKETVLDGRPAEPDIPELKRLQVRPDVEAIIGCVSEYYAEAPDKLKAPVRGRGVRTPARAVAMYLCQEQAGITLREIAERFSLSGPASAGASIRNVREKLSLANGSGLRRDLECILQDLTP